MMGLNNWTSKIDLATAMTQCIVYKAMCTDCNLTYIGVAQSMLKRRIVEHINGVHGQANENTPTLSTHMALQKHWQDIPPNEKLFPDQIRLKISLSILFQANL
eukprot:4164590-Ditylum_brightwellii.AAC.1